MPFGEKITPQPVFWFTGLSGGGKTTISSMAERSLRKKGLPVMRLDGDDVRHGMCRDLGFSLEDRRENIRRVAEMARLVSRSGVICICALISPLREYRKMARDIVDGPFYEVYIQCSIDICAQRDVKGLYAQQRSGRIAQFTGVSSPYEAPEGPDLVLDTESQPPDATAALFLEFIRARLG